MNIKLSLQQPFESAADLGPSQFSYLDGMRAALRDLFLHRSGLWCIYGAWMGKKASLLLIVSEDSPADSQRRAGTH